MTHADDPLLANATDEFLAAMVAGDAQRLGSTLADGFVLTHMTGYQQPKQEWLDQLAEGQFRYYAIDEQQRSVHRDGTAATVESRTLTDARVYGTRATWRLRLVTRFRFQAGGWTATDCIASTW
jgi:ketosteroid isomerase-like protein